MTPREVEYARELFTDLVVTLMVQSGAPPCAAEVQTLVEKAIEMAKALTLARQQASSLSEPKTFTSGASSNTNPLFVEVAREWTEKAVKRSAGTSKKWLISRFQRYVIPHLGSRPIDEVQPSEILSVIRSIESAGYAAMAYTTFKDLRYLYRYALAGGLTTHDPTATLRRAINKPKSKGTRMLLDPVSVGRLLVAIRDYAGKPRSTARYMLRLAPMLFLRASELRTLEWKDVDLDAAIMVIPEGRMKSRRPHIVPLARQAVRLLQDVYKMTGNGRFVFTSGRGVDKPLDYGIYHFALGRLGFRRIVSAHGFRVLAASWLSEQGWRQEVISRQLSHLGSDRTGRLYNRAEYLPERRKMMQAWADHLKSLEHKARRPGSSNAAL